MGRIGHGGHRCHAAIPPGRAGGRLAGRPGLLASETQVALVIRERFHLSGGDLEIRRANLYRLAGDRITEVWIFEANLLGSPGTTPWPEAPALAAAPAPS